ncbi:MAG: patatin-like phospholipase family protein, partial [Gemmataceae bacterium]|nr:patatin-like phospholipase family protein [Gemmataceae bacterium]
MRSVRLLPLLLVLVLVAAVPACSGSRRNCVPDHLASSRDLIDLSLPPDAHAPVSPSLIREVGTEFRRRGAVNYPPGTRPYHFLALSGGGLYGAFGAGVMLGWTEAGTRPPFDVVTGISIGGLMATFAFLGPQYDDVLRENSVGIDIKDILRRRSVVYIPFADAVYSVERLQRKIEQTITPQVLAEVAAAHAGGRRLYVGTTNLDSRRLIIWDLGAIAARGTPEAHDLYRKVVLASGSVPGGFPPVRIPVEIDGRCYEELHVDGGASDEVIFRSFMVSDLNRANGRPGAWAPPGSTLYVINNGKLYATPGCVKPRIIPELNAAYKSIIYGKGRDEFYRIYLNCLETGVDFRLTAIPQDLDIGTKSLNVEDEDQRELLASGYQIGRVAPNGSGWRELPPGTDPA